jgi:hypothetical protein
MHVDRPRRKAPRRVAVLWVGVLVAASCSAAALASAGATQPLKLGGTWSGSYEGPYTGTFTLRWRQARSRLRGTITLSSPQGTYNITGSVHGTAIKFGAVGVGALYSGSVSGLGLSMSGNWTSGPASGTWKAHKLLTASSVKVKIKKS